MKKQLFIFVLMLLPVVAYAFDIVVNNDDGVTIYYNYINDGTELEVTRGYEVYNNYRGTVVIPDEVTYMNRTRKVTSIGDRAFTNCTNLTSITIPSGVTSIGMAAFAGCTKLTSITIPNGVTSISYSAFKECSLTSINIPNSVTIIREDAFYRCSKLTSVHITDLEAWCKIQFGNSESNPLNCAHHLYLNGEEIKDLVIPNSVTSIGRYAFYKCSGLTSVTIPNSVTNIGSEAFYYCSGLTSVTIPNSVTMINSNAFYYCTGLTSVTIGNSVAYIGYEAFCGCSGLTSITIPHSVTSIKEGAFADCSGITSIDVITGNQKYDSRDNCNGIVETETNTLIVGCQNTIIPNSVTKIGNKAFRACTSLASITIPNSVTSIGEYAFASCSGLTSITIPNSVKYIGEYAFAYFYLQEVISKIENPFTINTNTFSNNTFYNSTLYVPAGTIEKYKATGGWNKFVFVEEGNGAPTKYTLTYVIDEEAYKTYQLKEGETITPEPAPTKEGYTFSGWSEIPETMPAHDVTVTGTFTVNKYKLIYKVDGEVYRSYDVEYGASITQDTAPTKEGYTFSGWSEIPETMPAHDVTVTGTFSINKYKLVYQVDGTEYKSYVVEYGASITPEPAPTKEGYAFSGWSEIPETMPAHDVTITGIFTINKYKLTYIVDGETYKEYDVKYRATITAEAAPTKEGYTFSGWSEIPETMPAHDVTVTGTFTINKYKLTYIVDGEEYKSYEVEYGATVTPEMEPTKEGYTFSGWSVIPETMPAHDVTISGTFSKGAYKLIYKVDGEVYKTISYDYGDVITPESDPTKEGYTFSGWSDIPETMPAHDVTVTGTFSINSYKLTYMIDNKVYMEVSYEYGATITPEPQPEGDYQTFEWTELPQTMPAHDVVVHANYTTGIVEIKMTQGDVHIYSPDGKPRNELQKGLNIVRMSDGTVKKIIVK